MAIADLASLRLLSGAGRRIFRHEKSDGAAARAVRLRGSCGGRGERYVRSAQRNESLGESFQSGWERDCVARREGGCTRRRERESVRFAEGRRIDDDVLREAADV